MRNLLKLFGKIKTNYLKSKNETTAIEDDSAIEEYHNPFLGLYGYQDKFEV
ncbi:MAG: hypothetical protein AB8F94_12120 [Saprospiraceae bacterium]